MSVHIISAVLKCREKELTPARRMVLVVLADHAAGDDARCWPSQKLIGEEAGCEVRTVKHHLKWLEENDFITRSTKHLGQGNGSRTSYKIHLSRLAETAPENDPDEGAEIAGANNARANNDALGSQILPLTNRQEPSIDTHSTREDEIDLAFEGFCSMAEKRNWTAPKKLTPSRKAALRKRLKENTLKGWGEILRKCAASDFLCGLTDRPFTLTIDWLLKPANTLKVLEGNYDNRTSATRTAGKRSNDRRAGSSEPDAFERLAARLAGAGAGQDVSPSEDARRGEVFTIDATAA